VSEACGPGAQEAAGDMRAAAEGWRAIFLQDPSDWVAWRAHLRCALATCEPHPAAHDGEGPGGRTVGGAPEPAELEAAQARPWRTLPSRNAWRRVCERVRVSASPARMDRALRASAPARRYRL